MNKKPSSPSAAVHSGVSGFTLFELLSAVSILGILTAALIPSITGAIESARGTVCRNNLRQMIIAAHAYECEYGEMPPSFERNPAAGTTRTWEDFLWGYDERALTPAASRQVHQCPSFKGAANWGGDHYAGYNYNASYIGAERWIINGAPDPGDPPSASLCDIKHPERCAVFGDGQYESGANKFMRSPFPGPLDAGAGLASAGTQGFRHRGRTTNVAFADGSVRVLRDRHTQTASRTAPAKNCGFLSPDNTLYTTE